MMINNELLGPVVLDSCLTGARYLEFSKKDLTGLLGDVSLAHLSRVAINHCWIGRSGFQN